VIKAKSTNVICTLMFSMPPRQDTPTGWKLNLLPNVGTTCSAACARNAHYPSAEIRTPNDHFLAKVLECAADAAVEEEARQLGGLV
jgi:hypothetical protein